MSKCTCNAWSHNECCCGNFRDSRDEHIDRLTADLASKTEEASEAKFDRDKYITMWSDVCKINEELHAEVSTWQEEHHKQLAESARLEAECEELRAEHLKAVGYAYHAHANGYRAGMERAIVIVEDGYIDMTADAVDVRESIINAIRAEIKEEGKIAEVAQHIVDREITNCNRINLRDQFALAALTGFCIEGGEYKNMAECAYKMADAMLKAREEGEGK